jgi:hypothetical protein
MVTELTWQDGLTMTVACACAIWVLWTTVRPFVQKVASACGICTGCESASDAADQDSLLQIAPAGSVNGSGCTHHPKMPAPPPLTRDAASPAVR